MNSTGVETPAQAGRAGELKWLGACGVIALVLALVVTAVVAATDGPAPGDVGVARFVQDWFPIGSFDGGIRSMNNTEALSVTAAVAAIGLWYTGRRQQALILVAGMVVLVLFTLGLKYSIDRGRPDPELIHAELPGRSPGYPSGHAITSAMLFGYLGYIAVTSNVRRLLRVVGLVGAAVMMIGAGVATIHTGVHWPSDVVGGYLWAAVLVIGLVAAERALARRAQAALTGGHT